MSNPSSFSPSIPLPYCYFTHKPCKVRFPHYSSQPRHNWIKMKGFCFIHKWHKGIFFTDKHHRFLYATFNIFRHSYYLYDIIELLKKISTHVFCIQIDCQLNPQDNQSVYMCHHWSTINILKSTDNNTDSASEALWCQWIWSTI